LRVQIYGRAFLIYRAGFLLELIALMFLVNVVFLDKKPFRGSLRVLDDVVVFSPDRRNKSCPMIFMVGGSCLFGSFGFSED
jgi:hypothetical protein